MKYIVYLTTNLVNHKIYVGVHKTEDPSKFDGYYGNGVRRGDTLNNPKTPFQFAIKKYGYDNFSRSVIKVFDSYEEALDLEEEIVTDEFIKRNDVYNAIVGGGMPPIINKCIYQYDMKGTFVKEWKSINDAGIFYKSSPSSIGRSALYKRTAVNYLWSFEKFDKLDTKEYSKYSPKIPVYIYDSNGLFVKGFDSHAECIKYIDGNLSHLQRAIKLGCKTRGYYVSLKLTDVFEAPVLEKFKGNYHQYDLNGNYIQSFKSVKNAEETLNIKLPGLNDAIKMEQTYKGFIWKRGTKLDSVSSYNPKSKSKKVAQLDDSGNIIKIFNTVREARNEFPNVSKVLNGCASHCHGFKFKYYTEEVNEIV